MGEICEGRIEERKRVLEFPMNLIFEKSGG
jgi:hypothetical protein